MRTLLVIPTFNDSKRLRKFSQELNNTLDENTTVLFSDDGSGQEEGERIILLAAELKEQRKDGGVVFASPTLGPRNRGKGNAVRRGWEMGEKLLDWDFYAFADADGAVAAQEIKRGLATIKEGEAVLGARTGREGATRVRAIAGRVFEAVVRFITGTAVADTQCGFKVLSKRAYKTVKPFLQTDGFAFDVELILLLEKFGVPIRIFPVKWEGMEGSKVRLFRDVPVMVVDIILAWLRVGRGGKRGSIVST